MTNGELLVSLSGLPTGSALQHLLAITQTTEEVGSGLLLAKSFYVSVISKDMYVGEMFSPAQTTPVKVVPPSRIDIHDDDDLYLQTQESEIISFTPIESIVSVVQADRLSIVGVRA